MYPIYIGELVALHAMVNAAWRTSMEVGVRVEAENPQTGEIRHTNTAYLTLVALDENGDPSAVPQIIATTPVEQRRQREAALRRENRLAERAQILAHREQSGPASYRVPPQTGETRYSRSSSRRPGGAT